MPIFILLSNYLEIDQSENWGHPSYSLSLRMGTSTRSWDSTVYNMLVNLGRGGGGGEVTCDHGSFPCPLSDERESAVRTLGAVLGKDWNGFNVHATTKSCVCQVRMDGMTRG